MIQINNLEELIAHLIKTCDKQTLTLLFDGKILPSTEPDKCDRRMLCKLRTLKFLLSINLKESEPLLLFKSSRGVISDINVELPQYITEEMFRIAFDSSSHFETLNVLEKAGINIYHERGTKTGDTTNVRDMMGEEEHEMLCYLKK